MDQVYLSGDQFVLVSMLIELGFMASLASFLATTRFYQRLLRQEKMRPQDPLWFALSFGLCLSIGVGARVLLGYSGMDLTLPGSILAGVFAGPLAGALVGTMTGGTAVLFREWAALPYAVLCGLVGGAIAHLPDSSRQRWECSPYPYMNVYRLLRSRGALYFVPVVMSVACLALDVTRTLLTQELGAESLWSFRPNHAWVLACVWLANLIALGVPIKIWNNTRLEMLVKEQEELAVRARLEALTQQINPHFLFNTLNSISAAARLDPEMARRLIQKLSTILRRVLDKQKHFVPLEEELAYIDSYLDIEVARFGVEKLRIVKEIDAPALQALVPCMVLQPLVENAVLHALAPLPSGGTIVIRARCRDQRVHVEVADDGMGFDASRLVLDGPEVVGTRRGIGLANVHQRLKIAYGRGLDVRAERGVGTRVGFQVPFAPSRELAMEAPER